MQSSAFSLLAALCLLSSLLCIAPLAAHAQDVIIGEPVTYYGLDEAGGGQNLPPLKLVSSPKPAYPDALRAADTYAYAFAEWPWKSPRDGVLSTAITLLITHRDLIQRACQTACRRWKWDAQSPAENDPRRAWAAIIFNPASAPESGDTAAPRLLDVSPVILIGYGGNREDVDHVLWAKVTVGASGAIKDVKFPRDSKTTQKFANRIVDVVKTWKIAPARKNGVAMEATIKVPVLVIPETLMPVTKSMVTRLAGEKRRDEAAPDKTASPATRAPRAPSPAKIGQLAPIKEVDADYPSDMVKSGMRASVTVEFALDDNGCPQNPVVVLSPDKRLDKPALDAIRKHRFEIPDPAQPDSLGNTFAKLGDARWQYEINFAPPRKGPKQSQRMTRDVYYQEPPARDSSGRVISGEPRTITKVPGLTIDKTPTIPGTIRPGQNITRPVLAPESVRAVAPVYPYEQLKGNVTGSATARMPCNTGRKDTYPCIMNATKTNFGYALAAALRYYTVTPRLHGGKPAASMLTVTFDFDPANPALQLPPETLRLLADEKQNPGKIIPEDKLGMPLQFQKCPRPSSLNVNDEVKGVTIIEFLVDETGRVHLPRIIETKTPEAAYILMQEISMRVYEPPLQNGKPVVARARETLNFDKPQPR